MSLYVAEEESAALTLQSRLDYLQRTIAPVNAIPNINQDQESSVPDADSSTGQKASVMAEYHNTHLDRMIVDYCLRQNYAETANALTRQLKLNGLVDTQIMLAMHNIEASLLARRVDSALTWCRDNTSQLKKMKVNEIWY